MQGTARSGACTTMRCRQKQYYGVRSAVQFILPILNKVMSSQGGSSRECFFNTLVGMPPSLAHEGPLAIAHLNAFASFREGELLHLFDGCVAEPLESPPSSHVTHLWTAALRERYSWAIRKAFVGTWGDAMSGRLEAGSSARGVFATLPQPDVANMATKPKCRGEGQETGGCTYSFDGSFIPEEDISRAHLWCQLIDAYSMFLPDRSPLHELENLPQEIGIGELLLSTLRSDKQTEMDIKTVIDIGGGNGFLATQLAERFGCESLVVDPFTPKHAIDNVDFPHWNVSTRVRPCRDRQFPLRRIPVPFQEVDWEATRVDFDRCAIVAKHLCGTSIDVCLRHLVAVNRLPRVLVVIPCCFNKGHYAEYCNPGFLSDLVDVSDDLSWSQCTKLTDWNRTGYCKSPGQAEQRSTSDVFGAEHSLGCAAGEPLRKTGRKKRIDDFLPCMDDVARLVEVIINHGRVLWLRGIGYETSMVEYVPRCVTPKNRAIVAVRTR